VTSSTLDSRGNNPGNPQLLPPWDDPAWQRAATTAYGQSLRLQLEHLAGHDLRTPLPPLTPDLYGQVHLSGERLPFERVYQERRRRLARAAVRLLMEPSEPREPGEPGQSPPRGVWWAQLLAAIQELLAEQSWAWPAHVRNPSGIDPAVIDLFAAETANLCGELVSLFGPWLPRPWVAAMRQRVQVGMVNPFLANPSSFWWTNHPTNWNAVCHQGLMGAALALDLEPQVVHRLLEISKQDLEIFIDGFSKGGSCLEGITYWSYGFGWYVLLNEQLERYSRGENSLIKGQEERIRAIARFGPAMLLRDGQQVNFADSRLDRPPRASLLMLLGRRLQLPECTAAGIRLYQQILDGQFDVQHQRCDLFYLTRMLLEAPTAEASIPIEGPESGDWIDTSAGLVVVRRFDGQGRCWELAVKGGHNDEPHNHNDCGSFLLNVDGERLAIELGAPEYTADTFGPKRYDLLATRSSGHSVPIVNGWEQAAGQSYAAELLQVDAGPQRVEIELDLSRAYPEAAGHRRLIRRITLDCLQATLSVEDELWGHSGSGLESMLITTSDGCEALGLQALAGSELQGMDRLQFWDNRGEELSACRWKWQQKTAGSNWKQKAPQRVGFKISPR